MAITRWTFVRHAPVIGGDGILYATHDEPADCSDTAAFVRLARAMPKEALLVTSGLKRTEATADALVAAGFAPWGRTIDARLAEQHYGEWHGRERATIEAGAPQRTRHRHWFTTADDQPPGGESFRDVARRVAAAMEELTARHPGRAIVAVSHGGAIRAALAHALGLDLDRALTISCANLSATRIDHVPGEGLGGDWRTVFVNLRP